MSPGESEPPVLSAASPGIYPAEIPSGAGFGIRLVARVLDVVYGFFLGLMAGVVAGVLFAILSRLGRLTPDWPRLVRQNSISGFCVGLLGAFLYHPISEGIGTATVGKLMCGLRVVQVDGRPATMKGAFIRDLAYFVDALFFGLVGYISMCKGPLQQRFGDVWGGTVVVKAGVFQPSPPRGPLRMAGGIVLGSFFWAAAIFAQMVLKVT